MDTSPKKDKKNRQSIRIDAEVKKWSSSPQNEKKTERAKSPSFKRRMTIQHFSSKKGEKVMEQSLSLENLSSSELDREREKEREREKVTRRNTPKRARENLRERGSKREEEQRTTGRRRIQSDVQIQVIEERKGIKKGKKKTENKNGEQKKEKKKEKGEKELLQEFLLNLIRMGEKETNVFFRNYTRDSTLVEQSSLNSCFFYLVGGSVRFEKRRRFENEIKETALLGRLSDSVEFPFFCELSALGIEAKTSTAIIADESASVAVIPVEILFSHLAKNPKFHLLFFKNIARRLAWILDTIHQRKLKTSGNCCESSYQIHQETIIFSWPCSYKSPGLGITENCTLVLSRNYLCVMKQREGDDKGGVIDVAEGAKYLVRFQSIDSGKVVLELIEEKLIIRDNETKTRIKLKGRKSADPWSVQPASSSWVLEVIQGLCASLKLSYSEEITFMGDHVRKMAMSACRNCKETYCVRCQILSFLKNPCSVSDQHIFPQISDLNQIESPNSSSPVCCCRCGNEGSHVILPSDLAYLLKQFRVRSYVPGEIILRDGEQSDFIGYILDGSIKAMVKTKDGNAKMMPLFIGQMFGEVEMLLGEMGCSTSVRLTSGEMGCSVLEIPHQLLMSSCGVVDDEGLENRKLLIRLYFALILMMKEKIVLLEKQQVELWEKEQSKPTKDTSVFGETLLREGAAKKKNSSNPSNDVSFLGESLLRAETGQNLDERGNKGWY